MSKLELLQTELVDAESREHQQWLKQKAENDKWLSLLHETALIRKQLEREQMREELRKEMEAK